MVTPGPRFGLARVLSKRGVCSRSVAAQWVVSGRVTVNGRIERNPEFPVREGIDKVGLDGHPLDAPRRCCLMLNKPRGLLTTTQDEQGRDTVYRCFDGHDLPWLAPVGRLDKASEGLLLFSNDPAWAARLCSPQQGPDKTYAVQVRGLCGPAHLQRMGEGIVDAGERLAVKQVEMMRQGEKNSWLRIVLDEGRNRQIRRILAALNLPVMRLIRIAVGNVELGELGKGEWRWLSEAEMSGLG
ncbi:pseudouridine synthase [Pseudomarimonas arenosa]